MLYKLNLSAVPVSLVGLVGSFTLSSSRFLGFFENKLVLFESSPGRRSSLPGHTHLAARAHGRACWPARLPGAGTASPPAHQHQLISTNLHLPVATQPQALPRRFCSDSSTEQEAAHFQFIALFTGYIIPPWKSLSALWHFTGKIL